MFTSLDGGGHVSAIVKITGAAARINAGLMTKVKLGNLDARRDWGYGPEYVQAMWRMLQNDEPDDFVIATGEAQAVRESADVAFKAVNLDWEGHVVVDETLYRPSETQGLRGDSTKAWRLVGWAPQVRFQALVRRMVKADLERVSEIHR
jgi:GDPmannose 4,6-dehydratase